MKLAKGLLAKFNDFEENAPIDEQMDHAERLRLLRRNDSCV